ncbi:hypothetical protein BLS_004785 [Venturia inaequalis]|uniref:Uncharacterized protein n=1 Tax=Venturia inaequalis TaxID=5025 RepID=A0A8H3UJM7_VENIN|nr:hypothetical protein BLS_004785 [Venturia inaequalis]RDI89097.1 hypothetical protein Vi05172_g131 [Venturia inaequalis]
MQKWQFKPSVYSAIRRPLRTPPQCAFSTSQSRLDDERPRSNRQASAKAGRLIANLNTRGAPERMRDPGFGLRGLKPYDDQPKNNTANTASGPLRIRRIEVNSKNEGNPSNDRPRQSSDRSAPRRNDLSSQPRNPARSFDRSSSRGPPRTYGRSSSQEPPRRESGSGQYSASTPRREGRDAGRYDRREEEALAALEEEDEEEDEEEKDIQLMVEREERLASPVQEEWEVMDEDGNIVDEAIEEEDEEDEEDDKEYTKFVKEMEEEEQEEATEDDDESEELDIYSGEDEEAPAKWEQEAYEMMEMTQKQIGPAPKPYNPKAMTAEELHTAFITTGAGELGVAAAAKQVMGRLGRRADVDYQYDAELASRLYQGKVVRFRDAEEKKRVMWMAEEFASNTANRIMEKKGEWEPKIDVGFVPVPEQAKEEIAGKAMRGIYPAMPTVTGELARLGQSDQEKTMAHLRRSVLLNETYSPAQGKSMVDFIAKIWPTVHSKTTQSKKQKGS